MSTTDKTQFDNYKNLGMLISMFLILIDIYYHYFPFFREHGYTHEVILKIILICQKTGLMNNPFNIKLLILLLAVLFVVLDKGKKNVEITKKEAVTYAISSTLFFLSISFLFYMKLHFWFYITGIVIAYMSVLKSYNLLHRLFDSTVMKDRFNKRNKIFPQMTESLTNELSVNIPYKFVVGYSEKKDVLIPELTDGIINIVSPERASLVLGMPGSGKSYSFNEEIIRQHIMKAFSMINYDFKFPTLTNIAYNYYSTYKEAYDIYENKVQFAIINIDDPRYSHRCNPISSDLLQTKQQAIDAVYTLFFNLDKKSATKQDFFQMSAMSITTAALWFLRLYKDGRYCSLPHLIELIQQPDDKLLPILDNYPELRYFTSSFTDALAKESFEQLSGQTASARIPLGKCATDEMFYVMTDPDNEGIDLRVNRKDAVTILNVANNPETQKTNAPGLGLYMSQAAKLINAQGRVPCTYHIDEFPTIFVNGINTLIATARSNKVCVVLSAQDYTQLVQEYGKEIADTIFNTVGNVFCGKVAVDTADKISKTIGKVNYRSQSISINQESTSTSVNTQRDFLVPPEDIAQLSQGEFVGIVSDTFKQQFDLKAFRGFVSPSKDDLGTLEVPMINPDLTKEKLAENTKRIQNEIKEVIQEELLRMQNEKQKELEENEEILNQELPFTLEASLEKNPESEGELQERVEEEIDSEPVKLPLNIPEASPIDSSTFDDDFDIDDQDLFNDDENFIDNLDLDPEEL